MKPAENGWLGNSLTLPWSKKKIESGCLTTADGKNHLQQEKWLRLKNHLDLVEYQKRTSYKEENNFGVPQNK